MTIRRGRILGRGCQLTGEGKETRSAYPAGRIYECDPQVVERLRAMMAQGAKPPARKVAGTERVPATMERMTVETVTGDVDNVVDNVLDLRALHGRYMAGESVKVLAAEVDGVPWQSLLGKFKEAGMPRRAAIDSNYKPATRPSPTVPLNGDSGYATLAREMVAQQAAAVAEPTPTSLPANVAAFLADMRALGGEIEISGEVDVHIKIRF